MQAQKLGASVPPMRVLCKKFADAPSNAGRHGGVAEVRLEQPSERDKSDACVRQIALFIDGANLHATAKTLGFDIDYKRLLEEFESRGTRCARSITRRSSKIRNIPRSAR
jgi:hypothetical protein